MPFPLAHALIGAGLFLSVQNVSSLRDHQKMLMVCAAVSILPDADFACSWIFDLRGCHRGFTHSLVFGLITGFIALLVFSAKSVRRKLGLLLASTSHGVLDAFVTTEYGTGIELLWPFSERRMRFGIVDYFSFGFDPRFDPWIDIAIHVLKISLIEIVVLAPIFIFLLLSKSSNSLISAR